MATHDIGGGSVCVPEESRIDAMCDALREKLLARGATLESMLADLREYRDRDDG